MNNIACRIFKEQLDVILCLPELEQGKAIIAILKNAFGIENNNIELSVSAQSIVNLLKKTIVCKEFASNYGGKRIGAGRKKPQDNISIDDIDTKKEKTISKEEKQQAIDDFTNNFGKKVGKNQVQITDDFKLPDIEYFNAYRKNYPTQLIQNVENWLIKSKKNETIDYQWIGNLIQKFNKRKTGNPL